MAPHGNDRDHSGPPSSANGEPPAEPKPATPGPMGRDRVHDGASYYTQDADAGTGPGPAPDSSGHGGSMGGGAAATGGPGGAARAAPEDVGDSQGGSLHDGSAADSQS